jgi:ketosteroid isomerase-like protein
MESTLCRALAMIKKAYNDFNTGNIPALMEIMQEDIIWQFNGSSFIPMAGTYEGKNAVLHFYQLVGESVTIEQYEPGEFIEAENKVVVVGKERTTAKATGKTFTGTWIHIRELEGDKLKKLRLFVDTAAAEKIYQA